jgi:hypothetical protein
MTIRTFRNRKTGEVVSMPTYEFRVKYELDPKMFWQLTNGKAKRCGNWLLVAVDDVLHGDESDRVSINVKPPDG